jgi:glycosyltransferase involved in cell wall biosynthesis
MHICLNCVEIFSWGKYGGYGRATRELGRILVKDGVEVTAVVPRRHGQKLVESLDGIRVLSFPMMAPWRAQALFGRCNADIFHSQEPSLATYFAMKARPDARHVVTIRDPKFLRDWLVELRYPSISLARTFLSRFYDFNFLVRSTVQKADAVLCATFDGRMKAKALYRLAQLPQFMPSPITVPVRTRRKSAKPTVCMVGRWDKRKRPEIFFELASRFPHVEFIAVGTCHDRRRDRALRERYSRLRNLTLAGWIDQFSTDALFDILAASWILINTSAREGLPTSILEAMACRCAILSSVNPDGVTQRFGFHVTDDDYDVGLKSLLAHDRWARKGEAAREFVLAHFETNHSMNCHLDLYRGLMANR